MEEKVRAVVLRGVDYKDNDKILTLFSLESGLITAAIRGVKKAGAKLKFAAQPFCFCEYVLSVKGDRRSVTSAEIIDRERKLLEELRKKADYVVDTTNLKVSDFNKETDLFYISAFVR